MMIVESLCNKVDTGILRQRRFGLWRFLVRSVWFLLNVIINTSQWS